MVALKDTDGNMEDPDSNQWALTLANSAGTSRNSLLFKEFALSTALDAGTGTFSGYKKLERTSTGLYFFYAKVAFDATEEEWLAQFGWEEGAVALYELRATQVTDAANDLGVLLTRCSAVRMAELDASNLPADIAALPTATAIVDEWETQSQANPTGFQVNVRMLNGSAIMQTGGVAYSDMRKISGTSIIGLPGQIAGRFSEFFNTAVGAFNVNTPLADFKADVSGLATPGDDMNLADDAITAAKYDETTAFPVKLVDTGATKIARTGADGDTLETISDQIDGIMGSTGTGARTISVTVNNGVDPLEKATVRFSEGANTYVGQTSPIGLILFSLDDFTFDLAISKSGHSFTPTTLVVDGDKTEVYSMTIDAIDPPPNASTTTGVGTYLDEKGVEEEGVTVTVQILEGPGDDGLGYDSTEWAETTDVNGIVQFAGIVHGAKYSIWRGDQKAPMETFTAPLTGTSFDLKEVIGRG